MNTLHLFAALALALPGCTNLHSPVDQARERLRECVEEHSPTAPECEVERARVLDAQKQYETQARRNWKCLEDPIIEVQCP